MQKSKKIYLYFFIFITIFLEWGYVTVVSNFIPGFLRLSLLLVFILPLLFYQETHIYKKKLMLFIYICLFSILTNFGRSSAIDILVFLYPIFIGLLFSMAVTPKQFIIIFSDVIFALSVFSLISYFIALFFPSILSLFPTFAGSHGSYLKNLVFSVVPVNVNMIRNYGIVWEPGAFAVLLNIVLFFQLFCSDVKKTSYFIVYFIALITTYSTMGYFAFLGILSSYMILNIKSKFFPIMILILYILGVLLFNSDIAMFVDIQQLVFGKLDGFSMSGDNVQTTQARVDAIIYPAQAFFNSPIVGIGIKGFQNLNSNVCNGLATNTIINWFSIGGIMLGIPLLFCYFRTIVSCFARSRNIISAIILCISFAFLVSTESLLRISLMYTLIFYSFSKFSYRESL